MKGITDAGTIYECKQLSLGAALGHKDYTATYVTSMIQAWCDEVKRLAEIADIFPHATLMLLMQHLPMDRLVTGLT